MYLYVPIDNYIISDLPTFVTPIPGRSPNFPWTLVKIPGRWLNYKIGLFKYNANHCEHSLYTKAHFSLNSKQNTNIIRGIVRLVQKT